jgi:hypothetical protein
MQDDLLLPSPKKSDLHPQLREPVVREQIVIDGGETGFDLLVPHVRGHGAPRLFKRLKPAETVL